MTYLFCLLIYLLTVALIGCQPIDTCYDDVSDVLNAAAKGWMRMSEVRVVNTSAEELRHVFDRVFLSACVC